jgi:transcriptional regulator with XRE-family HTH domain
MGGAGAKKRMTPAQCRAARLIADMTQAELAALAVLPATLITDFETGVGAPEPRDLDEIKSVLEWAGVEFLDGGQPGVRLREAACEASARPPKPRKGARM